MPKVSNNPYFKSTHDNLKNVVSCYTVCLKWNVKNNTSSFSGSPGIIQLIKSKETKSLKPFQKCAKFKR